MTPYEILLSESQERMLVVATKGREAQVQATSSAKWDLTRRSHRRGDRRAGVSRDRRRSRRRRVPRLAAGDRLPGLPSRGTRERRDRAPARRDVARDRRSAPKKPIRCGPWSACSRRRRSRARRGSYRQYDSTVRTSTVVGPGAGGRRRGAAARHAARRIALKTDCNGRYVYLDPRVGGRIAVAEAARNVACTGGRPMAITNCLNFGNPKQARGVLPVPRSRGRDGRGLRGVRHAGHRRQRLVLQREPARRGVPDADDRHGRPARRRRPRPPRQSSGARATRSSCSASNTDELGASEYLRWIHGDVAGAPPACDLEGGARG